MSAFKRDSHGYNQVSIANDYDMAVVTGEMPDIEMVRIFGRNNNLGTSAEDIWVVGGTMSWPTAASALAVWSSSTADANTTTAAGLRTIQVKGLLAGWTQATEIIGLNGTSTVTSSNSFIRINEARAYETGVYDGSTIASHGTVYFAQGGTATGRLLIDNGMSVGRTQVARFSVPAHHEAYIRSLFVSVAASKTVTLYVFVRESADDVAAPFRAKRLLAVIESASGGQTIQVLSPEAIPEKSDIWIAGIASGAGTAVSCEMVLFMHNLNGG